MPSNKKKKIKKGKTKGSKCKCSSHIQNTKVTIGGERGGGGGAPIVYATYAPAPTRKYKLPCLTKRVEASLLKFERNPYNNKGVNAPQGNY